MRQGRIHTHTMCGKIIPVIQILWFLLHWFRTLITHEKQSFWQYNKFVKRASMWWKMLKICTTSLKLQIEDVSTVQCHDTDTFHSIQLLSFSQIITSVNIFVSRLVFVSMTTLQNWIANILDTGIQIACLK